MRCLILGGDGMLGHQLLRSWRSRHEVCVTLRGPLSDYADYGLFDANNSYAGIDVSHADRLLEVFADFRPQAVVNCIGIIKQRTAAHEALPSLEINAVFPHRLRLMCEASGARLVHMSTDCVFNGRRGGYHDEDPADAEDLYGLSKYLGEIGDSPAITLRSSIIGLELKRKQSLIEWFLAQRGQIRGFRRAIYTGLTTAEMARVIEMALTTHRNLHGVWQVASQPISKFDLLSKLAQLLGRTDIEITPDDGFTCDRSLNGEAFSRRTGYCAPGWDAMLAELADEIDGLGAIHNEWTAKGCWHAAA